MSFFVSLQHVLPQHLLSRFVGGLAASELPFVRTPFIHLFARAYGVNMDEAARPSLADYHSFNDFFTRTLKPGTRPLPADDRLLLCPADGAVSQRGTIQAGQLMQAKGIRYSFEALADSAARSGNFEGGSFLTVYLAPSDYHRVHLPLAGTLTESVAIPGALYSVNTATEHEIEGLFCRNERLVMGFDTAVGRVLVIMVGALIVASIDTPWPSPRSPYRERRHDSHNRPMDRGAEVGRFLLGSTVILCFERDAVSLNDRLEPGRIVRMGEAIGAPRAR
ncbi:MAG: phosphatidylserine decarboxylase [Pseudomonadales bacterium]|nr:phosphatidylserine decarboxylase [Pseudomonadales bacterium]